MKTINIVPDTFIETGKNSRAAPKQLASAKHNAAAATAQTTAKANVPAPQSAGAVPHTMSALIAAAGLPADRLSAVVLSFARYFSLPLKPELMAALRRQVISSAAAQPPPGGSVSPAEQTDAVKSAPAKNMETIIKNREALSLAAAAAESKGVELTPKGLTLFAEAVDPDWQRRHGHDERNRDRKQHKEQGDQGKESVTEKNGVMTGAELKEMILQSAAKDPLLALLNRLPGKNGQRWIALPFDFTHDDRDFNVTLRILVDGKKQTGNNAGRMVMDIVENGTAEKRWLFTAESAGFSLSRLSVSLLPELPSKLHRQFINGLSGCMGIPPGHITVKNFENPFPCESDSAMNITADSASALLRIIDKAV
ncbi:MAG: hypothetical protein FWG89_06350 [Treponema sp.]|nr:hypothetical protein [Treponema sp.]